MMRSGTILALVLAVATLNVSAAADSPPPYQSMQRAVLWDRSVPEVETLLKAGFDPRSPIGCGSFDALDGAIASLRCPAASAIAA
jgi:hypothetical protein